MPARRPIPPIRSWLTLVVLGLLSLLAGPRRALAQNRTYVLKWTAPGDDSTFGRATAYDIRFSQFPITTANFTGATTIPGAPTPSPAGTQETFTLYWLNPNLTYYMAMIALDERNNASKLSNVLKITPVQLVDTPRDSVLLALSAPWPNPARSVARLNFSLPATGNVEIEAFDVAGHRVRTLAHGPRAPGQGSVTWDLNDEHGSPVASGVYFLRAQLPGLTTTRSLVVVH